MDEMTRTSPAIVFPGMSPFRFVDVGKFLLINPFARELVADANAVLGYSVVDFFREAEGDYSEPAQVAYLLTSLALAQWAEQEYDGVPDYCTGPGFGEVPASVYAGSLSFTDGVRLSARLGRCFADFFANDYSDIVTHAFVRMPEAKVADMLTELGELGEWSDVACYIDTDFYLVSLRARNLAWLKKKIRGNGGLSLYTTRPPLHSVVFEPLRRKVEDEVFDGLTFRDALLPIVDDHDGGVLRDGADVRNLLLDSIIRPLRWPSVAATLEQLGVGSLWVAGPDTLFGRVRSTTSRFDVVSVNPRLALQPRRRGAGPSHVG